MGLSDETICRQPFSRLRLVISIIGEAIEDKIVQDNDAILREEIAKDGLARDIWQYFTALTNMDSVGVMDNERSYLQKSKTKIRWKES